MNKTLLCPQSQLLQAAGTVSMPFLQTQGVPGHLFLPLLLDLLTYGHQCTALHGHRVTMSAPERLRHLLVDLRTLLVLPLQSPASHLPFPSDLGRVAGHLAGP